jgi:signal transduction histidine kinase/CHASE3 domain sensor protein
VPRSRYRFVSSGKGLLRSAVTANTATGLRPRLVAVAVVVALAVAASFVGLFATIDNLRGTSDLARHSEQVLAASGRLQQLVLDLETGQRGYALTHQPRFLEPWRVARSKLPGSAAELERLVADNPAQTRRAVGLAFASRRYVDLSKRLIAARGAAIIPANEAGKRQVDAIRRKFSQFNLAEESLSNARRAGATSSARRALMMAGGGLLASLLLLAAFIAYLLRVVVAPVRRLAAAAGAVAAGDLETRLPDDGVGEVRALGRAFNGMTSSLQESRDELESQNAELELQTAELEEQQVQLGAANDELFAQSSELTAALEELQVERQLAGSFYEFGEAIAGLVEESKLGHTVLGGFAECFGTPVALLYTRDPLGEDGCTLAATLGIDRAGVESMLRPGAGIAGQALVERKVITAAQPLTTLALPSATGPVPARHEVHIPLLFGEEVFGTVTLARVDDRPFSPDELIAAEHLAGQASGAYANLFSFVAQQRLATINAAVLDATNEGIVLWDDAGNVVLQNSAFIELMAERGITPALGLATGVEATKALVEDPDAYVAWFDTLKMDPEYEGTLAYRMRESRRTFLLYTAPVGVAGARAGRLIVMRDTTAEREAEQLKTDLVATVSHELRTPLASILGFAELLNARDPDPETRRKYVQTIYSEGQRLTALVNDFLDLHRIEHGDFQLSRESVDVAELLEEEIEVFDGQSSHHTFELKIEPDRAAVTAEADRARLTQVIGNLFSNAVKYSPDGGVVAVTASRRNGAVRVSVADRGIGIPAADRNRIFEKFFRASSDGRTIGGTGLGLAVCKEIVEAHDGTIGFDTSEGNGSTFWFEVPVTAPGTEA